MWILALSLLAAAQTPANPPANPATTPATTPATPASAGSPLGGRADPGDTPLVQARVLITEPKGTGGRDVKGFVGREVAAELQRYPSLEILAWGDLRRIMELESARQLTACDDAKMQACLADLQSALGVPWAVFVDVDEVGGLISIGLSLVAADGTALARQSLQVTDVATLHDALVPAVRALVTPLHAAVGAPLPTLDVPVVVAEPNPAPWVIAGVGGVVALGGVAALLTGLQPRLAHDSARSEVAALRAGAEDDPSSTSSLLQDAEAAQLRQRSAREAWDDWGQLTAIAGGVAVIVGASAVTGGLVWGLTE